MDITVLIALAIVLLILVLTVAWFLKSKKSSNSKTYGLCFSVFNLFILAEANRPRPVPNRLRDGAPRRAQMVRNRGARLRANGTTKNTLHCFAFNSFLC